MKISGVLSSNLGYSLGFVAWNFNLHLFHIDPLVGKHARVRLALEWLFCFAEQALSASLSPVRRVIRSTYYVPRPLEGVREAEDAVCPLHGGGRGESTQTSTFGKTVAGRDSLARGMAVAGQAGHFPLVP